MTEMLGPYEIRGELGRGAMAIVWRAWDPRLEREVAIKEPVVPFGTKPDVAAELGARFVREGKAVAGLNHPGIVTIYGSDVYDGRAAIVMELIDGETLADVLSRGPLSPSSSLAVLDQLLGAAGYAHSKGVVHRDIKPDNIFITTSGHVKLADFGIAHAGDAATLTQAGTVMGTPGYMAPEQVTGRPVDARSDIFAIGVIGYELLTGRNPFGATDAVAATTVMYRIVHEAISLVSLTGLGASPQMGQALARATAKDPAARFPDTATLRAALRGEVLSPAPSAVAASGIGASVALESDRAGRAPWLPYVSVAAAGLVVVAFLLMSAASGVDRGSGTLGTRPSNTGSVTQEPASSSTGGDPGGTASAPSPSGSEVSAERSRIEAMLERWRASREALDYYTYIGFYATDFYSADGAGQDYSQWSAAKRKIYASADSPEITFSNVNIVVGSTGQYADVTLDQRYRSDSTNDDGQKSMRLRQDSSGEWRIVREDFTAY